VSRRRPVPDAEYLDVIHSFEYTAFRLELQRSYAEPEEDELFAAFLRGNPPDARAVPELREWYAEVTRHVAAGKTVQRVRVQDDPLTDYQRFERWLDRWNLAAGEVLGYLTRRQAYDIGLLPAAGSSDWWLLDSSRLLVMHFDDAGRRMANELTDDPSIVVRACRWRDMAVHHAASMGAAAPALRARAP
jgi:hypothetical protein